LPRRESPKTKRKTADNEKPGSPNVSVSVVLNYCNGKEDDGKYHAAAPQESCCKEKIPQIAHA